MMKKKTNKLISNILMPIIGIGSLILSVKIIYSTDLIPNISVCGSFPNILCKLPIIRLLLNALSLKFAASMLLYASIVIPTYFAFIRFGFKESEKEFKETKADKKKWNRYGIYAALIFIPFYIAFLIFFAE